MSVITIGDGLRVGRAWVENMQQEHNRLSWAIRMVLRDFDDNNSPCLSIAAVKAILSVETIATIMEEDDEQKYKNTI